MSVFQLDSCSPSSKMSISIETDAKKKLCSSSLLLKRRRGSSKNTREDSRYSKKRSNMCRKKDTVAATSVVVISRENKTEWTGFLSLLAEELVMIRYLCGAFLSRVNSSEWVAKHIRDTPVTEDEVLDEYGSFFSSHFNSTQKHEAILKARSQLQDLLSLRKKDVKSSLFFGVRSVMENEDFRLLDRQSSLRVVMLLDEEKTYRGHVYLFPAGSSSMMTMKGIRGSVQNLLCVNPIQGIAKLLVQGILAIGRTLHKENEKVLLGVDTPFGPMPQILFDLGFRTKKENLKNLEIEEMRPAKIRRIGNEWFWIWF